MTAAWVWHRQQQCQLPCQAATPREGGFAHSPHSNLDLTPKAAPLARSVLLP